MSDDAPDLTSSAPLTLYPGRGRWLGLTFMFAIFAAAGGAMAALDRPGGWTVLVASGLALVPVAAAAHKNAFFLRLDADGFTVRSFWRGRHCPWRAVDEFRLVQPHAAWRVGWSVTRSLRAPDGVLPDGYGMEAEALAELMTEWRARYATVTGAAGPRATGPGGG